ncbi:hypothetical protein [Mesorhizobium retamae]|uniref:hypothetical protein n=1 Tax=Mesorhizobium retamae TaxID=2912854 RepID=UPI001EF46A5A|nr:hypothetical protein [Mesorhizobium sp. IRAMC:0171]
MTKNDGGPAFPQIFNTDDRPYNPDPGMSLRDFYAAHALTGLIARMVHAQDLTSKTVKCAFDVADAMIAERNT